MQAKPTEGECTRQYVLQKSYVHETFFGILKQVHLLLVWPYIFLSLWV